MQPIRLLRDGPRKALDMLTGAEWRNWSRVAMKEEMEGWVRELQPASFDTLEISGSAWKDFGFKSYEKTSYPEYDICSGPLREEAFDLIIADQVFEHLLWPYRAGKHVYGMLRPGVAFCCPPRFS